MSRCSILPILSLLSVLWPTDAVVNLFITKAEMNRTLGVSAELWYIENGEVNMYSTKYAYRVDQNVGELRFRWNAVSENKIKYIMQVDSSDMQVVAKLRTPATGYIPRDESEFAVEYRCAGSRSGQFEVILLIEFAYPERNHTVIRLRQEKICSLKDGRRKVGTRDEDRALPGSGSYWMDGQEVFYFIIGAAAAFLALIAFLLILYFRGSKKDARGQTPTGQPSRMISSFRSSFHSRQPFLTSTPTKSAASTSLLRPLPQSASPILERAHVLDVKKCLIELYADRNLFQIIPFVELEGNFGEVRWAIWRQNASGECGDIDEEEDAGTGDEAVIVKTLKANAGQPQFERFLTDCFAFHHVPPHPNLSQVAAAASFGRFENPETVSDFPLICYKHRGFGNLKKFLLSCRAGVDDKKGKSSGSSASGGSGGHTLRTHELVSVGLQVARALQHLHKYGVLHKDVSTRNCIVSELPGAAKNGLDRLMVQVVDCALSRDLFPSDYACLGDNENRPVKWMAPELLHGSPATSATDIWSFGILLWELMSCGANPWLEVDPDEVLDRIERGDRPPQPYNCPDQLYCIMVSCWVREPRERPTASQLLQQLVEFNIQLRKYI